MDSGTPLFLIKTITFTVADPPDKVLTYYRGIYNGSGWRDGIMGRTMSDRSRLSLVSSDTLQRSSSDYLLDVAATPSVPGGSDVQIEVSVLARLIIERHPVTDIPTEGHRPIINILAIRSRWGRRAATCCRPMSGG